MFVDKYLFLFLLRTAKTNGASLINQKSVRDSKGRKKRDDLPAGGTPRTVFLLIISRRDELKKECDVSNGVGPVQLLVTWVIDIIYLDNRILS
jgi:hypothetical protein